MVGVGLGEPTDTAWAVIETLLLAGGGRGKPLAGHWRTINGIL